MPAENHVHPAFRIVERTERLWTPDAKVSADRAKLVIARLIEAGYLSGRVEHGVPLEDAKSVGP